MRRARISNRYFRAWTLLLAAVVTAGLLVLLQAMVQPKPAEATFPGENGRVAFENYVKADKGYRYNNQIFTINPNGTDQRQLTYSKYDSHSASWSPDGKTIAFVRENGPAGNGWGARREIHTIRADGSRPAVRLTNNSEADYSPSWSPDGEKIAFGGYRDDEWGLFVIDRDGSNEMRLTGDLDINAPEWSPDGSKIAYSNYSGVFIMNADGSGEPSMVTSYEDLGEPENGIGDPKWSPDSQWLVFDKFIDQYGYYQGDVMKVKYDGTELDWLGIGSSPIWSPDGTKIVFDCNASCYYDDGPSLLYMMNADGTGEPQMLTGRKGKRVAGDSNSWQTLP